MWNGDDDVKGISNNNVKGISRNGIKGNKKTSTNTNVMCERQWMAKKDKHKLETQNTRKPINNGA